MARAARARNSWMERMLEKQVEQKLSSEGEESKADKEAKVVVRECKIDKEAAPKIDVQPESAELSGAEDDAGMDSPTNNAAATGIHWLLKTAIPEWTFRELQGAKEKLTQVGILGYDQFEDALREKGALNQRLRDQGLKVFGVPTLARLRKIIDSERDRKRCEQLLAERRRREHLEDERRRLDGENKATMEPAVRPVGNIDEFIKPNDSYSSGVPGSQAREAVRRPATGPENVDKPREATNELPSSPCMASPSGPLHFRDGLSDGLFCGQSWEWPLTRVEKRERITMMDREMVASLQEELEDLKARTARKKSQSSEEQIDYSEQSSDAGSECNSDPRQVLAAMTPPRRDSESISGALAMTPTGSDSEFIVVEQGSDSECISGAPLSMTPQGTASELNSELDVHVAG